MVFRNRMAGADWFSGLDVVLDDVPGAPPDWRPRLTVMQVAADTVSLGDRGR